MERAILGKISVWHCLFLWWDTESSVQAGSLAPQMRHNQALFGKAEDTQWAVHKCTELGIARKEI